VFKAALAAPHFPTSVIPQSALLKDDVTFVSGINLLSGHFYGDLLAKQEHTNANHLATTQDVLRPARL
jgi:hypothetical protein